MAWEIILAPEVDKWYLGLDERATIQVRTSIDLLSEQGPNLPRPYADRIHSSKLHNLKELRPRSTGQSEFRILFVFDSARQAILLVAGDKSGNWDRWYVDAVRLAEARYARYQEIPSEEIA